MRTSKKLFAVTLALVMLFLSMFMNSTLVLGLDDTGDDDHEELVEYQIIIKATDDAYVRGGSNADENYGTMNRIRVREVGTDNYFRSFLKFNLEDIEGIVIESLEKAELKLYCYQMNNLNKEGEPLPDQPLKVMMVHDDDWDEEIITGNTKPESFDFAEGMIPITTIPAGGIDEWYSWDVTSFVKEELLGDKIVSLEVAGTEAVNSETLFYSIERPTNWPQLVLTYYGPPLDTDATLSSLTVSEGTLDPAFDPAITSYTVSVSQDVYSIGITPVAASEKYSSLKVNGNSISSGDTYTVSLDYGMNLVSIEVVAQDTEISKNYTVEITRSRPFLITEHSYDTKGGITATVKVTPQVAYDGDAVVVFQLMDENTPESIVAIEPHEVSGEFLVTGYFNVAGSNYSVKAFVLDHFDKDETAPVSLAAPITLGVSAPEKVRFTKPQEGIWTSAAELSKIPMTGPAWKSVQMAADLANPKLATVSNQESNNNIQILACGIVYARTGEQSYKDKVVEALEVLIETGFPGDRTLAWGRETGAYVIAADLVGYRTPQFEEWLENMANVWVGTDNRTLRGMYAERPNNWGTMAFGSLSAIYAYLDDQESIEWLRQHWVDLVEGPKPEVTKYGDDLSWHYDENDLRIINPKDAVKNGINIDGIIPDDMRRGESFMDNPEDWVVTGYAWEVQQGWIMAAHILDRAGMHIWDVGDQAIYRAAYAYHERLAAINNGWACKADALWVLPFLENAYGTNWSEGQSAWGAGKCAGFGYVLLEEGSHGLEETGEDIIEIPSYLTKFDLIDVECSGEQDEEGNQNLAIHAIDGDPINTRWASKGIRGNPPEEPPEPQWITVILDDVKTVSATKISFFAFDQGRVYIYSVDVSTDNENWTNIIESADSVVSQWSVQLFDPVDAKYVRITIEGAEPSTNWAGIYEVEIYGESDIDE